MQARSVFSFMPPFPTITRTPVVCTNSYSNFSILMDVVGPTDTISYFSSPSGRMIGPACSIAASRTSTGISLPSSTTRRCATSRQVVMSPVRYTISPIWISFRSSAEIGVNRIFFPSLISTAIVAYSLPYSFSALYSKPVCVSTVKLRSLSNTICPLR